MKILSWSKFLLLFLITLCGGVADAQSDLSSAALDYIFRRDLKALHQLYKTQDRQQQLAIENAFYGPLINLDNLTYEQLKAALDDSTDGFNQIISRHLIAKENAIIDEVSDLTVEELYDYHKRYPERSDIVDLFLLSVVKPGVDSISYEELSYIDRQIPALQLSDKLSARASERIGMVRGNSQSYLRHEQADTQVLADLLRMTCSKYVALNYQKVPYAYSKIGIVPDNPAAIDKQFRMVVNEFLKSKELNSQLKKIVNIYCKSINKARAAFAKEAGITGYPQMSVTIPEFKGFTYSLGNDLLSGVPAARKDFYESRESAGSVIGVVGSLLGFGDIAQGIAKGIYDMSAVDGLADKEIAVRKEMVATAYNQITYNMQPYIRSLIASIESQISANQKKFIDYVANK